MTGATSPLSTLQISVAVHGLKANGSTHTRLFPCSAAAPRGPSSLIGHLLGKTGPTCGHKYPLNQLHWHTFGAIRPDLLSIILLAMFPMQAVHRGASRDLLVRDIGSRMDRAVDAKHPDAMVSGHDNPTGVATRRP